MLPLPIGIVIRALSGLLLGMLCSAPTVGCSTPPFVSVETPTETFPRGTRVSDVAIRRSRRALMVRVSRACRIDHGVELRYAFGEVVAALC